MQKKNIFVKNWGFNAKLVKQVIPCQKKNCTGMLEFDYGNAYGTFWTCNVCLKQQVLPTKKQLKEFPNRFRFYKKPIEVIC